MGANWWQSWQSPFFAIDSEMSGSKARHGTLKACATSRLDVAGTTRNVCVGQRNMPIFEYQCFDCGTKFEEIVLSRREQSENSTACSDCGSSAVERLFSTFAAHTSSDADTCFNKAEGICQAGGGNMPCGQA